MDTVDNTNMCNTVLGWITVEKVFCLSHCEGISCTSPACSLSPRSVCPSLFRIMNNNVQVCQSLSIPVQQNSDALTSRPWESMCCRSQTGHLAISDHHQPTLPSFPARDQLVTSSPERILTTVK